MRHQDSPVPGWINKWLIFNAIVLFWDGLFCVLRPRSLPGGDLDYLYPVHAWYIKFDLHYGDVNDNFILVQGMANVFIEFPLCVLAIFNILRFNIRGLKFLIIVCSIMTFYKTILFFTYSMDLHVGGHVIEHWFLEIFGVFGVSLIWVFTPAVIVQTLISDFLKSELHRQ